MHKFIRDLALAFGLVASANAAISQKAEMPAPDSFKAGDKWEWRQVDNRTKLEEGRSTRTVVEVDGIRQFSDGTKNFPISTSFLGEPASKPWRVWPLEIGKKWVYDGDWTRPDGVTGNTKQDAEVVAFEEISTPAGKFMAYKIEYRGFFKNSNGRNGKQNDTYWYSPEVSADIKRVHDDPFNMYTRELTAYKRAAP
jgi:hypothetical protein